MMPFIKFSVSNTYSLIVTNVVMCFPMLHFCPSQIQLFIIFTGKRISLM